MIDTNSESFKLYAIAQTRCRDHAAICRECYHPIIDDEGNPGYLGEACLSGRLMLEAYQKAEAQLLFSVLVKRIARTRIHK